MTLFVFAGPTISRADAESLLDAKVLPPVAQGDVFRASKELPFAIGIVDGYFERTPAVWHKEILWALSRGIHVFGAASMGALRAAELSAFGMKGVGSIFEAFHSGEIEDDDEVAVAHSDASTGYRATSEAMVNIRATFRRAEHEGVIAAPSRAKLEAVAKGLWYPDRAYPLVFAHAVEQGLAAKEVDGVRAFVAGHRVDQKRVDAIAMLEAMGRCVAAGASPPPVKFSFSHTEAWDQVVDWAETQPPMGDEREHLSADLLAAEARLSGAGVRACVAGATRTVAGVLARRSGTRDQAARTAAADLRLRRRHGLDDESFGEWLRAHGLTHETYRSFVARQADFEWLTDRYRHDVDRHVVDDLRMTGDYVRVSERALDKQSLLAMHGLGEPSQSDAGIGEAELLAWYFEKAMGVPIPVDPESFLPEIGVPSLAALRREALREYLYVRLSATSK